eukprot:191537_1
MFTMSCWNYYLGICIYFLLKIHDCYLRPQLCPTGYCYCELGSYNNCSLSGGNIIAFGANFDRWAYRKVNGSFICNSTASFLSANFFPQCCYQQPKLPSLPAFLSSNLLAGDIECGETIYGYLG